MSDATLGAFIRADLEQSIRSGTWPVGSRIPTEHELMQRYGCSRMTVHKELAALAERGLIVRRRRAGTFVGTPPAERAVLAIADFAEEAAASGRSYRFELLGRVRTAGTASFGQGEPVLALACRHFFDDIPVAWEDRRIRIAAVPAIARARFRTESPGAWLLRHVPWTEAEHQITAALADGETAEHLSVPTGSALLRLYRRTWQQNQAVTEVTLTFPATRYSFTGRFGPRQPS